MGDALLKRRYDGSFCKRKKITRPVRIEPSGQNSIYIMKINIELKNRNIIIVHLNEKLKFEQLVPSMKEYILNRCSKFEHDEALKKSIMKSVSNLNNLFEQVYKAGMILYSTVHGKLEVETFIYAMKPYIIRTGDDLMNEIEEYLKE